MASELMIASLLLLMKPYGKIYIYNCIHISLLPVVLNYIDNNTPVRGNTRFISSVKHDISGVSAGNELLKSDNFHM